jgi:cytidine deaminase
MSGIAGSHRSIGINTQTCHAEEAALTNLINSEVECNKIDLIVIRTNKHDQLRNSKPCRRCISFMKEFTISSGIEIDIIHYSTSEGKVESTTFQDLIDSPIQHTPKCMRNIPNYY